MFRRGSPNSCRARPARWDHPDRQHVALRRNRLPLGCRLHPPIHVSPGVRARQLFQARSPLPRRRPVRLRADRRTIQLRPRLRRRDRTLAYVQPARPRLRANFFVAREEDIGVASGQYNFPSDELAYIDRHYFVLDHTPLVGASGGAAYRWKDYQFTLDGLMSSGLRGGFANETQLPQVWQFNLSAARDFFVARSR